MTIDVLVPTYGDDPNRFTPAPRLDRLDGAVVGVISNGKHGTAPFFDALATELRHRFGVAEVVHVVKANYSAPAGDDVFDQVRRWQAVVTGIGD